MEIKSYKEVISHLNKENRQKHLLLGNGFSMAYDSNIFSYNAFSEFISSTENTLLKKLFNIINTSNFELIMKQLDIFYQIAKDIAEDEKLAIRIEEAHNYLKESLVDAISALHPEQVFKIPKEKSVQCAKFLKEFLDTDGHIFTTNYDLLLYWVLLSNQEQLSNIVDGFGRANVDYDEYMEDFDPDEGELVWGPYQLDQHVHYVHGALHIFDSGVSIEKEVYDGDYLLTNIKKRIDNKDYPVFVTAGDGKDKLEHILHNPYLNFCYKKLSSISGSLVTFGFNFGEYDKHIINAINKANKQEIKNKLWSIYIGVYSDKDKDHIEKIKSKFKCKVNLFDAKTVNPWGN
ncbi:MAG: DUF4917 family protein [Calditrichaceae bacterium]|nr:DUF4917 family protein [Calditrichaceae bacterium]MBN2710325.1 DUF4917 family protein [Calditrichaceae bacterium]RQV92177.1 MAG: DUF4917 family protein [Calditrichota bacterium]